MEVEFELSKQDYIACIIPKNSFENESNKDVFFEFVNKMLAGTREKI